MANRRASLSCRTCTVPGWKSCLSSTRTESTPRSGAEKKSSERSLRLTPGAYRRDLLSALSTRELCSRALNSSLNSRGLNKKSSRASKRANLATPRESSKCRPGCTSGSGFWRLATSSDPDAILNRPSAFGGAQSERQRASVAMTTLCTWSNTSPPERSSRGNCFEQTSKDGLLRNCVIGSRRVGSRHCGSSTRRRSPPRTLNRPHKGVGHDCEAAGTSRPAP